MRIADLLVDQLNQTALFEMAHSRKDVKNQVTALSPAIFNHLLKLYVFDSNSQQHWCHEINNWFNQINQLYYKGSNRKPHARDLINWMIDQSGPHYSVEYVQSQLLMMRSQGLGNVPTRDYDQTTVLDQILLVIKQVCEAIADDKWTSIDKFVDISY